MNLADALSRTIARMRGAHDRIHPECGVWTQYDKPLLEGRSRTPVTRHGVGCPSHEVWIMVLDADAR